MISNLVGIFFRPTLDYLSMGLIYLMMNLGRYFRPLFLSTLILEKIIPSFQCCTSHTYNVTVFRPKTLGNRRNEITEALWERTYTRSHSSSSSYPKGHSRRKKNTKPKSNTEKPKPGIASVWGVFYWGFVVHLSSLLLPYHGLFPPNNN